MYHITSIDESLHNERRRREFCNGSSALVMRYINEQERFVAIKIHTYDTHFLFL